MYLSFCMSEVGKARIELCLIGMELSSLGSEACVGVRSVCSGRVMSGVGKIRSRGLSARCGWGSPNGRGARGSANEARGDMQCDAVCDVALYCSSGLVEEVRWVYIVVVLSVPCECD